MINHFYPSLDAAELTVPEFLSALESISSVTQELRPKTAEEVVGEMGKAMAEAFERNRRLREQRAAESGG